jgi:hypothetical protein
VVPKDVAIPSSDIDATAVRRFDVLVANPVFPCGHDCGSGPITASIGEIVSWLSPWLASESGFVERVTSNLPPTPSNFVRIVELNESGDMPDVDPSDLEAGANRCAVR